MSEARVSSLHGGRIKTIGGLRKSRFIGRAKTDFAFTFAAAAYNLVRLPKLLEAA